MFGNFGNANSLFASLIWGAIGSGYFIYGMRQRSLLAVAGGSVMVALSYFVASALYMSLASIGIIAAVYWLSRQLG
jgi:hypothetical protein